MPSVPVNQDVMTRSLHYVVFALGLAAACWIGAGYVASNPLALVITILIGAVYLAGALELYRYQQATRALAAALARLSEPPASLDAWLEYVPAGLRNTVRLRVEGERAGLPGPSLTPYLVGLLVLLGMLGTFLGMVATLRGTGLALESSTDLEAIRASLAAPVKGLGFAFGTSVAGVATSAMLGLLSALSRRERIAAAQLLDAKIVTTLRSYSLTHQREESFKLLQRQAELMPAVLDRLQAMMTTVERQSQAANDRLLASQDAFHSKTDAAYTRLAASVGQALEESLVDGIRSAGAAIQPAVEATMASLARETASLHGTVTQAVQQQLDGLSTRFESTTKTVADIWKDALAGHQRASESLTEDVRISLEGFAETFEQRSARLLDGVSTRLDGVTGSLSEAWQGAISRHEEASEKAAGGNQLALTAAAQTFAQHSEELVRTVGQAHGALHAQLASQDEQRLAAWTASLAAMASTLRQEWEQAGASTVLRQQEICEALARTAADISSDTRAHASSTIAELGRLVHAASEAPKAAADAVVEVRRKLSESMVRDNAMLEERGRLLETLETLLDAVNHASIEQRAAVDALVSTSANVLDRVGSQFTDNIRAETGKLTGVAAQVTSSAVEVASLGESFGTAVQLFSQSNESLVGHLQRIEAALDKSATRSDEQLAYYVAQAREVIDLSMLAQKQIMEDLQQLASQRSSAGTQAE